MAKLLFFLVLVSIFSGCESGKGDPFFYDGWKQPQDGADQRMYGTRGQSVPQDR